MKKTALLISLFVILSCFPTSVAATNIDLETTPSGILLSGLEQFVDEYAASYIGTTTAGASIVILKNGEILLYKSYGYADIENGVKADTDTVFEWGSDTKLLVWTSVMQLVEQGKLDLNADIREYLPDGFFTKLQFDTPITIYNLMHHNAGWEDCYTDLFYHSAGDLASLEETLRIFEPKQVNAPGTVVAYSNYGTALAGYIVERVSSQPFYAYVNANIFAALGMNDTSIHPSQADNASVAERRDTIHGYTTAAGGALSRSENERIFIGLYPAGSAIGTASDAAKFLAALMPQDGESSPLFENTHTLEEMLSISYSYGDGFPGIAHGFWENYNAVKTLGHGGNTDSFSSYFTISPETGFALVVMTNQAGETGLCLGLPNALFGKYATEYEGELPDAHQLAGSYITARRPYSGFTKVMGFLQIYSVKAIDSHTIEVSGNTFTQISPYVYQNDGNSQALESVGFLCFTVENGAVVRVSMAYGDLLPVSGYEGYMLIISAILAIACILYIIAAILIIVIGAIRNRRKGIASSPLKKLNISLNLAGIAALLNILILVLRAFQYSSYEALNIHFGINIAYMLFALLNIVFMIAKWKRSAPSRKQNLFYMSSCIASVILIVLMIVWELYK